MLTKQQYEIIEVAVLIHNHDRLQFSFYTEAQLFNIHHT